MTSPAHPSDPLRDEYMLGWLDAIWCGFSESTTVEAPPDVQRELIRRGWIKPRQRRTSERRCSVTPLGMGEVIRASVRHGIARTLYEEDGTPTTPKDWLERHG